MFSQPAHLLQAYCPPGQFTAQHACPPPFDLGLPGFESLSKSCLQGSCCSNTRTVHGLALALDGSAAAATARSVTEIGGDACFGAFAAPAFTVPITNFSNRSFASCECKTADSRQVSHVQGSTCEPNSTRQHLVAVFCSMAAAHLTAKQMESGWTAGCAMKSSPRLKVIIPVCCSLHAT